MPTPKAPKVAKGATHKISDVEPSNVSASAVELTDAEVMDRFLVLATRTLKADDLKILDRFMEALNYAQQRGAKKTKVS